MPRHVKKGDLVMVLSGNERGATAIAPYSPRALARDSAVVTRAFRPPKPRS